MFIGVDGKPYEVMGEPNQVFNLLSSPSVSVNARFEAVPSAFKGEDITDTVLGSVGVAVCDLQGGALQLHFDMATGNVSVANLADQLPLGSYADSLMDRRSAGARLRAAGIRFVYTWYECDLRWMSCVWRSEQDRPSQPHDASPALLFTGHARVQLRGAHLQLEISRHSMVRLGHGRDNTEIDCRSFSSWPAALSACNELRLGLAPPEKKEEWTLILATSTLDRNRDYFYFAQASENTRHLVVRIHPSIKCV